MFTNLAEDEVIFVEELDADGEVVARHRGLVSSVWKANLEIRIELVSKTDVVWYKFARKGGKCAEKNLENKYRISSMNAKRVPGLV